MAASRTDFLNLLNICMFLALISTQIVQYHAQREDKPSIAVIGAGIGGTSTVHFLQELFGDVEIDVFEDKEIGGRLQTVSIDGKEYEAGGSIIHPRNLYMVNFTKFLGLDVRDASPEERIGLWNGTEILFEGSRLTYWTFVKLYWRYGLDVIKINTWVDDILKEFDRIYEHQERGLAFSTLEDLLHSMSPRMVTISQMSIETALKKADFSQLFIDELVTAAMHLNYGQDANIHGFVGAVSLAGIQPGLWSVQGGNKKVPQKLIERSKVNVIKAKVIKVSLESEGSRVKYYVEYIPVDTVRDIDDNVYTNVDPSEKEYDIVILATPLMDNHHITFENIPRPIESVVQSFHRTVALFAQGMPNIEHFGYENLYEYTEDMLTTNTDLYFNSFAKQDPVDYQSRSDNWYSASDASKSIWKVFSNKPLTATQVNTLFTNKENLKEFDWLAYPEYSSKAKLSSPFVLHEHLYYVNTIEQAASAMETVAIGARNVALLAYNQWYGLYDNIDPDLTIDNSKEKSEL